MVHLVVRFRVRLFINIFRDELCAYSVSMRKGVLCDWMPLVRRRDVRLALCVMVINDQLSDLKIRYSSL